MRIEMRKYIADRKKIMLNTVIFGPEALPRLYGEIFARKVKLAAMELIVDAARHQHFDFKEYPGVAPGNVDITKCPDIQFLVNEPGRVLIKNVHGDSIELKMITLPSERVSKEETNSNG